MKLHYCKTPLGNFGDDLNTWLWPTLLGDSFFNGDEDSLFLGVGTILNKKIPKEPEKIVLGTGTGYQRPPKVDGEIQHLLRSRPSYCEGTSHTTSEKHW